MTKPIVKKWVLSPHAVTRMMEQGQRFFDKAADFACIKLAAGIEAKSYLKDGVLFSEDAKGRVIELQMLNVSLTTTSRPKKSRKAG